jgi:hypothetical protein
MQSRSVRIPAVLELLQLVRVCIVDWLQLRDMQPHVQSHLILTPRAESDRYLLPLWALAGSDTPSVVLHENNTRNAIQTRDITLTWTS